MTCQKANGVVLALSLALLAVAWTGCGSGEKATAPVSGTVTIEGQPVNGGSVTFAPVGAGNAGRPAMGAVESDGTFVLGTYAKGDGAVIGQHRVMYSPPEGEHAADGDEHAQGDAKSSANPYANLVPKTTEVEVVSGENDIKIELVPASG